MKTQNILIALLIILLAYFTLTGAKENQTGDFDSVRTKKFELIDDKGEIRASIMTEDNGETLLRMKDSKGEIRIKLGASENGSGLLLLNSSTEPGIQILAYDKTTSITLSGSEGKKQKIEP